MGYKRTITKDFKPWHRANAVKPPVGERVFIYFRYKYSAHRMTKASAYAYARWEKGGWNIENFPVKAEVITWQFEEDIDWDRISFNNDWIDKDEYDRRRVALGKSDEED